MTTKANHSPLVALPQDQQLVYCLRSSAVLLYWDTYPSPVLYCTQYSTVSKHTILLYVLAQSPQAWSIRIRAGNRWLPVGCRSSVAGALAAEARFFDLTTGGGGTSGTFGVLVCTVCSKP